MGNYAGFFVAFSLLLIHEMDAIRRHEWKIFPILARLSDDEHGYLVFTALHIPLYVLLLWGLFGDGAAINQSVVIGLDVFCLIHVLLHALVIKHPHNQFNNWFSWMLILGAGIMGGIDLLFRV